MHPSGAPERVDPPTHPPPDRPPAAQQHQFPPPHLAHLFTPAQPAARSNPDDILSELSAFEMHLDGSPQNPAGAGGGAGFDSIDDVLRAPPPAPNPLMMGMQQARQGKQRPPNYPPSIAAQIAQRDATFRQAQAQRALQLTAQGVHGAQGMQGLALQMQRAQTQKRQRAATAKGQMQHQMLLQQQQLAHHQQLQKRHYSPAQQRTLQGALQSARRAQESTAGMQNMQSQAQATLASQQMRDQWRMQQLHQQQQGMPQGSGQQGPNVAQQWLAQHSLPNFKAPVPGMQQPNRTGGSPLDSIVRGGFAHPGQSRGVPQHVAPQAQQNHALAARAAAAAAAAAASTPSNGRPPQKQRVTARAAPQSRTVSLSGPDADLTRRVCELEMEAARKRQRLEAAPSKDQYFALAPDVRRPFADCFDAWRRLLPYHVLLAPDPPPDDKEKRKRKKEEVASIYAKWEASLKEKVTASTAVTDDRPTSKAATEATNADDAHLGTPPLSSRDDLLVATILCQDEVAAAEEVRRQRMAAEAAARAKLQAEMQKRAQEQAIAQARAWREMQARAQAQAQAQSQAREQAPSQRQSQGHEQGQVYQQARAHNDAQAPLQAQSHQQTQTQGHAQQQAQVHAQQQPHAQQQAQAHAQQQAQAHAQQQAQAHAQQQAQAHAQQQAQAHAQQLVQAEASLQAHARSQAQSHSLPHSQPYSHPFSHPSSQRTSQPQSQSGPGLTELGRLLVPGGIRAQGMEEVRSNLHPPRQQQTPDANIVMPAGMHQLQQQGLQQPHQQQGLQPPQWAPGPPAAYAGSPHTPSGAPIGGVAAGRTPQ